jgi:hypothetical protein
MLRFIILATLVAVFIYAYRSVLFARAPLLNKLKRIPVQITVFAILALAAVNGFRSNPEIAAPQSSEVKPVSDVEMTAAIAKPALPEPLHPKDAAAACVEQAMNEAHASDDEVAEVWLSSVEGVIETASGEVTVQFAIGPRAGSPKGPQCRSEARLTCTVTGRDVRLITPVHMTGNKIAC